MLRIAAVLLVCSATMSAAQESSTPAPDSASVNPHAVIAYAIKSGRLMLSSQANPKPARMPDGNYANQDNLVIAFVDGSVTRLQRSTGEITEIDNMRINRQQRITLTPRTNALMSVSDVSLPSGTFTSEDGLSTVTIILGRPTEFTIPDGT